MQYIFQDPFASLSPRMTTGQILTEGLEIQGIGTKTERRARAGGKGSRGSRAACRCL
jgi:peptide/nickel transport system ATP-binding protein